MLGSSTDTVRLPIGASPRVGASPGIDLTGEPVLLRFPDRPAALSDGRPAAARPLWIRGYRGKRTCDILVSGALALLAAPVAAGIAAVLAVAGRRQVLEAESMLGAEGQPFRRLRFRTRATRKSTADAGDEDQALLPLFRGVRRPRTRFGRFLHATGLERLPELWSVLRGDLALVGPSAKNETDPTSTARGEAPGWNLKPGLVWLDSPSDDDAAIEYVARQSVLTDLRILARAFWKLATAPFREPSPPAPAPSRGDLGRGLRSGGRGTRPGSADRQQRPPDQE